MTWFDYGVLGIVGVSLVLSLIRGFAREVVSLVGWLAAFVLATAFGDTVAGYMPQSLGPLLGGLLGFLLVFIAVLLIAGFAGLLVSYFMRAAGMGFMDRSLGAVFGILRGALIVLGLVLLAGLTPLPREPFWRNAALAGPFETAVIALRPYLPDGVAQRLKYR